MTQQAAEPAEPAEIRTVEPVVVPDSHIRTTVGSPLHQPRLIIPGYTIITYFPLRKLDNGWPESEEKYSKICNCEDRIAWKIERKIYEDVSKKEDVNV